MTGKIREVFFSLREEAYQAFQCRLLPVLDPSCVIGVRTPILRKMARELWKEKHKEIRCHEKTEDAQTEEVKSKAIKTEGIKSEGIKSEETKIEEIDADLFLRELPHRYFEENQLHAFLIAEIRDFDRCVEEVNRFLPFVDNWATCDQLSPAVFRKHRKDLLPWIRQWMAAGDEAEYTVRFGIRMLMDHFLEETFEPCYPEQVAKLHSEKYYIRMMAAWYFATALARQYEAVLPLMEGCTLDPWTHRKAISKALESRRIPPEHKEYLRGLRGKSG